jgi:hypothetical protein
MIYRNANVVTDYEPQNFHGESEVENLNLIEKKNADRPVKTKTVIVTIEKPKPKIISFNQIIHSIKEYFSDPLIREELIQQIVIKVKEKHPKLNTKLLFSMVRVAILPMITVMIVAVNQIQYYV